MTRFRIRSSPEEREQENIGTLPVERQLGGEGEMFKPGGSRGILLKSTKLNNTVALAVALCVLLAVLVWGGVGGLDFQPSATSNEAWATLPPTVTSSGTGGETDAGKEGQGVEKEDQVTVEKTPDDPPGEFKGVVSSATAKLAAKKLNPEEIEAARQAAETTVRQALHSDHGLPPADVERAYPDSCNVVVEGLPLVGTKQQRCCKAPTPSRDGGSQGVPLVPPLQLPGGKGRKLDASEERRGDELPAVLRPQRTGEVGGQQVSCFPAFIIAGTQKSGTTALAGILESHPQVRMSGRKELHFFDTKTPNPKINANYANNFARFNASQALEHRAPFVVGEATPFYMASANACENMRKLVPNARLIVLVREPVKRAYSEYQMKVRRVEEQKEMLTLLAKEAKTVYDCAVSVFPSNAANMTERELNMLMNPLLLATALSKCSGVVGQHGKWMDLMFPFIRMLRGKVTEATKSDISRRAAVLQELKSGFNRCFYLESIARQLDRAYPGGGWRARWDRRVPSSKGRMERSPVRSGSGPPMAGRGHHSPLGHQWPNRNLRADEEAVQLEHGADWNARGWNGTSYTPAASRRGSDDDDTAYEWNVHPGYDVDSAFAHEAEGTDGQYRGYRYGYIPGELGEGGSGWLDNKAYWAEARDAGAPGSGEYYSVGGLAGEGSFESGEEGFFSDARDEQMGFLDQQRRLAVPPKVVVEDKAWGSWGEEGSRAYDETCYTRHEEVLPVVQVMRQELATLKKCFNNSLKLYGGLNNFSKTEAAKTARAMEENLRQCFFITPGISNQFIYRSLYGIQAYRCLKHMPREQVMFIESDDLRDRPEEILPEVHRHIGISDFEYPALGQEAIMAELEKIYPDFEKRTGWRLDSAYKEEMPADLAEEIKTFLEPHMQQFARLVGQSFGDWAVDDKHEQEALAGGTQRATEMFNIEFNKEVTKMVSARAARGANMDDVGEGAAAAPPR